MMASNRKLPFGYRMEQGEIKEHPVEAEAVRDIFRRYLAGRPSQLLRNICVTKDLLMMGTSLGTRTWWLVSWKMTSTSAPVVSPL